MPQEHINIRNTKIPKIGFGTRHLQGEICVNAVKSALEIGYRHVDTAQIYRNEEFVGQAIKESGTKREDIFLTTKIWVSNLGHEELLKSFDESLNELQTDYIDLLLLHWPSLEISFEESYKALKELKIKGKVKNIGVSNYPTFQFNDAIKISQNDIFVNQVEYHPFLSQDKLISICKENNVLLTAYSPLANGHLVNNEILTQIGKKYGKTGPQIALRRLIEQENVIAIPSSIKPNHIKENINVFDFNLDQEDKETILNLPKIYRYVNPPVAPKWDD